MRGVGKLSARTVATRTKPGMYADGANLWLRVSKTGTRSWIFRYGLHGRVRQMGLGSVLTVSLAEAREQALQCRKLLNDGLDPIEHKRSTIARSKLAAAKSMTFGECAQRYIQSHRKGWRSAVHAQQWENTLADYALPVIGDFDVAAVDVGLILKILEPIWTTRTETASRLRGRIEKILDWATSRGYRPETVANPARWKGHLETLLPRPTKVRAVQHLRALPYTQVAGVLAELAKDDSVGARALELCILTACRSGEVISARWAEVDLAGATWTIPAARVKSGRTHRVPLSQAALAVLERLLWWKSALGSELLFPGVNPSKPIGKASMIKALRKIDPHVTVHGFRSSFRSWAAEQTNYPREICEQALGHALGSKVESAYLRSDFLEKRKKLMQAWGQYCLRFYSTGSVIRIREQK
jgi:integrase